MLDRGQQKRKKRMRCIYIKGLRECVFAWAPPDAHVAA